MVPSKQKYEKYIGKYIKYMTGFGTYEVLEYGKITGIHTKLNTTINFGNNQYYFVVEPEKYDFYNQSEFECGRTELRIDKGECTLFTEEDTEDYNSYLLSKIK
tara:strand:- start:622 stop:930 length:309 start_codon:yes stop_codon:yes gene_type:complete